MSDLTRREPLPHHRVCPDAVSADLCSLVNLLEAANANVLLDLRDPVHVAAVEVEELIQLLHDGVGELMPPLGLGVSLGRRALRVDRYGMGGDGN